MFTSIIRSSAFSAAASVSSYLLLVSLARADSADAFAAFTYATVCALVIVMLIDCAADQCASHFMLTAGLPAREALRVIYRMKLSVAAVVVAAVAGLREFAGLEVPYASFFFVLPAFYLGPFFELQGRNLQFAMLLAAERCVLLIACSVYVHAFRFDLGVYVLHVIATGASLLVQLRLARIFDGPRKAFGGAEPVWHYVGSYWPVYLSLFAQAAYGHASRLVVEARRGLLVFAAVSIALQTLNALSIAQSQVDRHFRPAINRAAEGAGALSELRALLVKYLVWYVLPLCAVAVIIAANAERIVIALFGERWIEAAGPMRALAPVIVTVPLLRFVETVAVAVGAQQRTLIVNVVVASSLIAVLATLPLSLPVSQWLLSIGVFQAIHVVVAGYLVLRVAQRRIAAV